LKLVEAQGDDEAPGQAPVQETETPLPADEATDTSPNDILPQESAPAGDDARELSDIAQPTESTEDEPSEFDEFATRINQQFGRAKETADKA
jgi:hypothetical protein